MPAHAHRTGALAAATQAGCLGLLALAAGCRAKNADLTLGALGRVEFSYQRSCFFGCPLAQPLLSGTREQIAVTGHGDDPGVAVESSATDVAEFALERHCYCARSDGVGGQVEVEEDAHCQAPREKHCDNQVLVQAHAAGDATLRLSSADDQVIDQATVQVRDADHGRFFGTLESALGGHTDSAFTLATDDKLDLEARLFDDQGRKLLAPEGVHWRSHDAKVAKVSAFLLGAGAELDTGLDVVVEPQAAGETAIELEVPGLTNQLALTVTAP